MQKRLFFEYVGGLDCAYICIRVSVTDLPLLELFDSLLTKPGIIIIIKSNGNVGGNLRTDIL